MFLFRDQRSLGRQQHFFQTLYFAFIEFDEAQKVGVGTGPLDAQHLRVCNKILFNVHVINRWRRTGDGNPGE